MLNILQIVIVEKGLPYQPAINLPFPFSHILTFIVVLFVPLQYGLLFVYISGVIIVVLPSFYITNLVFYLILLFQFIVEWRAFRVQMCLGYISIIPIIFIKCVLCWWSIILADSCAAAGFLDNKKWTFKQSNIWMKISWTAEIEK